jgi:predicted RNA methylase
VGKRSRPNKGQDAGLRSDLKRCRRALRSLDLVDSRLDAEAWGQQVSRYVCEDDVDEWLEGMSSFDEAYDFSYSSFERALHFSVGWRSWPFSAECEWMLPRLRDAITRAAHDEPFLVEIGAGAGAAAAVISAALKVPVIAIDSHPKTLELAEQFASRTGGTVESRVADIADLADVLDGATPAAVFGMTIYKHMQPPHHRQDSFSDWAEMQKILATHRVDPQVQRFIKALDGADLVLTEMTYPEYLAEIAAGPFSFGYDIPQGGITRIDGATPAEPTTAFGIHFTTADLPKRNPNLLIEMFSPLPRPYAYFESDPDNDSAAEALRLSLEPTEFLEAVEIDYTDGSGRMRREVFRFGHRLIGRYFSTTKGYRNLRIFQRKDLETALEQLHADEAELTELGKASVHPCSLSAPLWGGTVDT